MVIKKTESILKLVTGAADDKLAVGIEVYDVAEFSSIVDFFVICSGKTNVHIDAIAHNIAYELRQHKVVFSSDGDKSSMWMVIDIGTIIVHVMGVEERAKYKLEKLWISSGIIYH